MTEKRYILESPADFTAARAALSGGGLSSPDTEKALGLIYDKFLAPIPKIFADKFAWMTDCAKIAAACLRVLPNTMDSGFYSGTTQEIPATPGSTKITTYDAPNGVPATAQAIGMTVEEHEDAAASKSETSIAAGTLSAAAVELENSRGEVIRKAFRPMILPIWGEED